MTLRLTEAQDAILQQLADRLHTSKQEAAIRAIEDQAVRVDVSAGVQEWAGHALQRYEGLLARLAQ